MASIYKFLITVVLLLSQLSLPGVSESFLFKGNVWFKAGEMYIIHSSAIRVSNEGLFDSNGEINYDECDTWCGTNWTSQPYQCVQVIEPDNENANPEDETANQGEYLCCGEMTSTPFTFTGKVQTAEGEKNTEECVAVTVKEDLVEFLVGDGVTSDDAYRFLYNEHEELDHNECDDNCGTYCSMRERWLPPNYIAQCVQVTESSNINVTPGDDICGCFHSLTTEPQQTSEANFIDSVS